MKALLKKSLVPFILLAGLACPSPAQAQISVRSSLSADEDAAPGARYEGFILVRNETDAPQQARIYQTDYFFHHDGTNYYGEPGSTPRSNAGWIQFNPAVLTLPPGKTLPVQYVVSVPDSAGGVPLEGTYWSMLMVEGVPPGSPESTLPTASDAPRYGVRQVIRYGVQIATHIQGTGRRSVAFAGADLVRGEHGSTFLHLDVENDGSLLVRPEVWVELYDASGRAQGRREGTPSRIYPGTSVRQRIDLGGLPSGTYRALVVVDAGAEEIYGAQYTLEL